MTLPKRPELKLTGNVAENFKNFEMRFNDYCIQAEYRNLDKRSDIAAERTDHYKKPQLEISALRSAMPDEALSVIRYTIEPQIAAADKLKPWVWMEHLRIHYTGSIGSTILSDRFQFWNLRQNAQDSIQDWEVIVRQAGSLCEYAEMTDEINRDKFIFGLKDQTTRTELLKSHKKGDGTKKTLSDVVVEAKTLEAAHQANKLILDTTKVTEEHVNWTSHKQMRLKREPGTCHWCGDRNGPHPWKSCPANGRRCLKCGGNDHFSIVCLEETNKQQAQSGPTGMGYRRYQSRGRGRGNRHQQARKQNSSTPSQSEQNPRKMTEPAQDVRQVETRDKQEIDSHYPVTGDYQVYALECHQIHHTTSNAKRYFVNLSLSPTGHKFTNLKLQIDTAATCNTISEQSVNQLKPNVKIQRSPYLLYPYGNTQPLKPLGQVTLICDRRNKFETLQFQVLPAAIMENKPALLSGVDSTRLGLIKFTAEEVFAVTSACRVVDGTNEDPPGYRALFTNNGSHSGIVPVTKAAVTTTDNSRSRCHHAEEVHEVDGCVNTCRPPPSPSTEPVHIPQTRHLPPAGQLCKEDVLQEYADSFTGIGCLGPPVHFTVKEGVSPVQMPIHRVPISKRLKEKAALQKYVKDGILAKVEEPTPWCSNELIRESPKKFRVCIDPSQTVNKAILRPIFQMPTLNEQLHMLYNAKCFSLVDVREGFLHCPLDEESSMMTTMHTSYGRYRWLRLPFGISSSPEEFQLRLCMALEDLQGILNVADDILVFGEGDTYEEAKRDHDRRFVALMERCSEKNIKLNPDKLKFKMNKLLFMGHVISDTGMHPDPDKVSAVTQMPVPRNKAGVQRFIGMCNYLSAYIPNLSTIVRPLRMITQDGSEFIWSSIQQDAFNKAKQLISSAPALMFYDLHKPVYLQVDASDEGLGGALLQPDDGGKLRPVAFTSCSLNSTEQRYSQIEKECLAICNCFDKFDQWLYGKSDIHVHTDHQPLETIFKKPLNKAPARLQKMMMRLQRYIFDVTYKKGTSLYIADTLSRAALPTPMGAKVTGFEVFRLQMGAEDQHNERLVTRTEVQLQKATQNDPLVSSLANTITRGWPDDRARLDPGLQPYWTYRDELSVQNGIIYKGVRVLIPESMQKDMLQKIHANHYGAESNLRMAKEVLFWPGMGKSITDMCRACTTCAQYGDSAPKEPMKSLPIPTLPWELISQDLFSLQGQNYLVTVCHFSDWIEVDELRDTLSSTVVEMTKRHFARFGVPAVCHTDNGPQFISKEYAEFARSYGFEHTTSSPYHSQGNGRAEAAVKVCKAQLRKSEDLNKSMLLYRNTPQQGHTYSPAQRMLSHRTRTFLPVCESLLVPQLVERNTVVNDLRHKRQVSKTVYDKSAGSEHSPLDVGSYVYAKPPPTQHGEPWKYGRVIRSNRSRSYTIQTDTRTELRRNRVHLRPAAAPMVSFSPTVPTGFGTRPLPQQINVNRTASGNTQDAAVHSEPTSHELEDQPSVDNVPNSPKAQTVKEHSVEPYVTRSGRQVKPKKLLDW